MRIEDRLTAAADRLRENVDASAADRDVDDALAGAGTSSVATGAHRRPRTLLLVAAAIVVLAGVVGAIVAGDDDERLVADEGETAPTSQTTTTTTTGTGPVEVDIAGEVLGQFSGAEREVGWMAYLGVEDALVDQWTLSGSTEPIPTVDFDQQAVLTFTLYGTKCLGPLIGLDRADGIIRPHFRDFGPFPCGLQTPETFVLAVDRAHLPETFDLVLDADLVADAGPYALTVDTSENFASFTPPQPGSSGLPAPDGPDLERPEPGREITFDRIGDVSLGQTLGPSDFDPHVEGSGCGYWGPGEPSHDGDEPLNGLVAIEGDVGTVISVMASDNVRYRTASGVGVGTSFATLERIYGPDLVVDRADGWESPTDGLLAQYVDVAAVRNGDRALTYYLQGDVVHTIKLSSADFWGDDEGCA